jgi:hypothetical protein
VNLGAGTVCANLRFDGQPIVITTEGFSQTTNLRKMGAIIGDEAQTGCHVVLNPGTLLGKGVWCYPQMNFGGYAPQASIIKPREKNVFLTTRANSHALPRANREKNS